MQAISSICIYCGSQNGHDKIYVDTAWELGKILARRNITIIYGHGATGLMAALAKGALSEQGPMVGILPKHLVLMEELPEESILMRDELTTIITDAMHSRKQEMFDRSDAFIVLPGSFGTLDEFFEILTWKKIHLHKPALIVFDINGYYKPLQILLDHIVSNGFGKQEHLKLFTFVQTLDQLLQTLGLAPPTKEET